MFLRHNSLAIAWAILILIVSGLPGDQFEKTKYLYTDKVIHAILFGVWFYLLAVGWVKQRRFSYLRVQPLTKAFILCLVYGVVVELMQGILFLDRSVEALDLLANVIGTVGGLLMFYSIYGRDSYT